MVMVIVMVIVMLMVMAIMRQNLFHTALCTCPGLSSLTLRKHLQSKDNYVALISKPPTGCVVSSICGEIVKIETVLEHSQG